MKTTWTVLQTTVIAAAMLCALSTSRAWAGAPLSTDTFSPAYPSGPSYDAAVASLPGLGLLPGGTTDRCDTNGEAELLLVISAFNVAGALEFGCSALPSPGKEACFAGITITALANVAAGIADAQCAFQDALIDGAEIEAAFENTLLIHEDLGLHDDRLILHDEEVQAKLDTLIARQLEVIRLLHTPNGQRTTDVPACNGQPCDWNFQ